jgi:hypothetical protein
LGPDLDRFKIRRARIGKGIGDSVSHRLDYNGQGDGRRSGSREREAPTSRAKTTHQYRNATVISFKVAESLMISFLPTMPQTAEAHISADQAGRGTAAPGVVAEFDAGPRGEAGVAARQ